MARILDVDTEAFAPTYRKVQEPREARADVELRRMGTKMGLVSQALPLVGAGAGLLDKYLVTPIQQALKKSREEEYGKAGAGSEELESGETPMQKIARERMAQKVATEPKGVVALEAQKPEYATAGTESEREELAKMFGQERPSFGEYRTSEQEAAAATQAAKEKEEKRTAEEPAEREKYARDIESIMAGKGEEPTETKYQGAAGQMMRATEPPSQRDLAIAKLFKSHIAEAGSRFGDMMKPKEFAGIDRPMQFTTPTEELGRRLPHPVPEGRLPAVTPAKPLATSLTSAGAEPGFAGTEATAESTQTAKTAKAAAAPAAPAGPKTLATASDDDLSKASERLKRLVQQNPNDPEFARRLRQVELEQRHREEKFEYEDLAAEARAADTLEKQRAVLEKARRVRMPVGGIQDLITPSFELFKQEALGKRGEPGLFPQMREAASPEQRLLYLERAYTLQAQREGKDPATAAKIGKAQAQADLYGAQAGAARAKEEETRTLTPFKAGKIAEEIPKIHAQEQKLNAETDRIRTLLPGQKQKLADESAKLKALAAKARSSVRRGGSGLSPDEMKIIKELNDRRNETVNQATRVETEAEAHYGRMEALAERAKLTAERAAFDASRLGEEGLDEEQNRKIRQAKAEAEAAKKTAEQAEISRVGAEKERINAQNHKREALRAGDVDKADADFLTGLMLKRRGIVLPSQQKKEAPLATQPAAQPAAQQAKPATTRKSKSGKTMYLHDDGKWYFEPQ